jgi:hypothetical protein
MSVRGNVHAFEGLFEGSLSSGPAFDEESLSDV